MTSQCAYCKTNLVEGAKFCFACGNAAAASTQTSPLASGQAAAPAFQPAYAQPHLIRPALKQGARYGLIGRILAVAIIIGAVVVYFALRPEPQPNPEPPPVSVATSGPVPVTTPPPAPAPPLASPQDDTAPAPAPPPAPARPDGSLDAIIPKQVGRFYLAGAERKQDFMSANVIDAVLATYRAPEGAQLGYGLASMSTPEATSNYWQGLIKGVSGEEGVVRYNQYDRDAQGQVIKIAVIGWGSNVAAVWNTGLIARVLSAPGESYAEEFLTALASWPAGSRIKWLPRLGPAYDQALSQGKLLVVYFYKPGGEWSAKHEREVISSKEVNSLSDRAVFVRVSSEEDDAQKNVSRMLESLKPKSYPFTAILSPSREKLVELGAIEGFNETRIFFDYLNRALGAQSATRSF